MPYQNILPEDSGAEVQMNNTEIIEAAECYGALLVLSLGRRSRVLLIDGALDTALEQIHELAAGALPLLIFGNTPVGRRCFHLDTILLYMQEFGFVENDGSTFTQLRPKMSLEDACMVMYEKEFDRHLVETVSYKLQEILERESALVRFGAFGSN